MANMSSEEGLVTLLCPLFLFLKLLPDFIYTLFDMIVVNVEAEDVSRSQLSVRQRVVSAVSVQTRLGGIIFHWVVMVVI